VCGAEEPIALVSPPKVLPGSPIPYTDGDGGPPWLSYALDGWGWWASLALLSSRRMGMVGLPGSPIL
jgi:hypothetical protein